MCYRAVLLCGLFAIGACRQSVVDAPRRARADATALPQRAWSPSTTSPSRDQLLEALTMPYSAILRRLGAHRGELHATLVRHLPGGREQRVPQRVSLRVDADGNYQLTKETDEQHGVESIWVGGWLYQRLRYSRFIRRRPRNAAEPMRIADRTYGLLPAYLELLACCLDLKAVGTKTIDGVEALEVRLGLGPRRGAAAASKAPARRWREAIRPTAIRGTAWLARATGIPLRIELEASCAFALPAKPPGPTGIPSGLDRKREGRLDVSFEQHLQPHRDGSKIEAPPTTEVVAGRPRFRPEWERQMVLGERKLIPGAGAASP